MAHAHQPMPGREEANADLRRVLADARQRELVEVVLDDVSVGDCGRLVHGVVVEPDDLPFDLLLHRQRVDQTEAGIVRDVTRSRRTLPARLTDMVCTMALIVARPSVSAPRSSSAIARAVPLGSGVPQPDISAAMSSALIMSAL